MKHVSRFSIFALVLLLLLTLMAATASADTQTGDRVVIATDEVVTDDLYVTAQDLVIDGTVQGDVLGFARTVTVNGTVTGDLMVGAQAVIINGVIEDDARVGCQTFTLNTGGRIGDDLAIGSFSFDARPESTIGGNLWFGSYQGLLAGQVGGDVSGGSNGLAIQGTVGGNIQVEVGEDTGSDDFPTQRFLQFMPELPSGVTIPTIPGGLTIGPNAVVEGRLDYSAVAEGKIDPRASVDVVTYRPQVQVETAQQRSRGEVFLAGLVRQVQRLMRLLLVGFLLVWLLPTWLSRTSQSLSDHPWPSLGWGALSPVVLGVFLVAALAVVLILSLVMRFVIGGAAIAAALLTSLTGTIAMVYLLLAFYLAALIAGFAVSKLLLARIYPDRSVSPYVTMAVGVFIVWGITLIPVLGGLIGLVLALFGLGATWLALRAHFRTQSPALVLAD